MIVHATGEPDSGKTRFILQHKPITKTAFFHDDVKELSPDIVNNLGMYVDMVQETKGLKLLELRDFILGKLKRIQSGQFDAIIFDTWSRTGNAFRYWGKLNATKFREASTFSLMGKMKSGEEWAEGRLYEAQVISDMSRLAPFVGLVTHLKDVYEGGAKTGQQMPDASRVFDRVCNFRVWLRPNPSSGVPIALVLKRLAEDRVNETGYLETVNVIPWKLTPKNGDTSVWDVIKRYQNQPFGNRQPMQDETPNPFEMSILTGVMTKEQREIWQANLREKHVLEKEELTLLDSQEDDILAKIKELAGNPDNGPIEIMEEINKPVEQGGFGRDFGPADILAYMDKA